MVRRLRQAQARLRLPAEHTLLEARLARHRGQDDEHTRHARASDRGEARQCQAAYVEAHDDSEAKHDDEEARRSQDVDAPRRDGGSLCSEARDDHEASGDDDEAFEREAHDEAPGIAQAHGSALRRNSVARQCNRARSSKRFYKWSGIGRSGVSDAPPPSTAPKKKGSEVVASLPFCFLRVCRAFSVYENVAKTGRPSRSRTSRGSKKIPDKRSANAATARTAAIVEKTPIAIAMSPTGRFGPMGTSAG